MALSRLYSFPAAPSTGAAMAGGDMLEEGADVMREMGREEKGRGRWGGSEICARINCGKKSCTA